jgi:small GTP-binding protein
MADSGSFVSALYLQDYNNLRAEAKHLLEGGSDDAIRDLIEDLPPSFKSIDTLEDAPISIGIVGQYDAGKSTLVKALTGRKDIPIDSDVCTSEVTSYNWNGVRLIDTPGIAAEQPEHDAETKRIVDQVDLLLFVITGGLFDDVTGPYFRELAFERDREREMLLVVNQMAVSPGTPEVKRGDIKKVTEPRSLEFFYTSFVDAKYHIKAEQAGDSDRRQKYLEVAQFGDFIEKLNAFIRQRGFIGKITTPFLQLRTVLEKVRELCGTSHPTECAAIELLQRRSDLLHRSKSRLRRTLRGELRKAKQDIVEYGDSVAESIVPSQTEEEIRAIEEKAEQKFRDRTDKLSQEADQIIEKEVNRLNKELQELQEGTLQRKIEGDVRELSSQSVSQKNSPSTSPDSNSIRDIDDESGWAERIRKASKATENIGLMLSKLSSGPNAGSEVLLSSTGASGSKTHKAVLGIGRAFNYKFKPWQAVNTAKHIGNVGRVLGTVGSILGVVAQVQEDKKEDQVAKKLQDCRNEIRSTYRDMAEEVDGKFWKRYKEVENGIYEAEIEATKERRTGLLKDRDTRTKVDETAAGLIHKIDRILDNLQAPASNSDNTN